MFGLPAHGPRKAETNVTPRTPSDDRALRVSELETAVPLPGTMPAATRGCQTGGAGNPRACLRRCARTPPGCPRTGRSTSASGRRSARPPSPGRRSRKPRSDPCRAWSFPEPVARAIDDARFAAGYVRAPGGVARQDPNLPVDASRRDVALAPPGREAAASVGPGGGGGGAQGGRGQVRGENGNLSDAGDGQRADRLREKIDPTEPASRGGVRIERLRRAVGAAVRVLRRRELIRRADRDGAGGQDIRRADGILPRRRPCG